MDKFYRVVKSKITVLAFLVVLGGLSVVNLLTPTREFSENENRYLQTFPKLTLDSLLSAKFPADFDQFITDQFVFRDGWVGLKTLSELALHKQSSGGVYFGEDGYLIEMFDSVDTAQYGKNLDAVAGFARRVQEDLGVQVSTMLAPSASMILADKLPVHTPEVDQRGLLDQAAASVPGFVDVSGALSARKEEALFFKTDHHWTSLGAFYAYNAWREQQGLPPALRERFQEEIFSEEFYGTTYSKASLYTASPDTLTAFVAQGLGPYQVDYNSGESVSDSIYQRSFLEVKDKYSVFLNANQPVVQITTGNQNGKKLLLIKDSYANAFVQMALADYQEIVVLDLRYYKGSAYDYVEEAGITDGLILYSLKGFTSDVNLYYLTK